MCKRYFNLLFLSLVFTACTKTKHIKQNPFEIGKQHIGLVTDSTQVKDLKTIFINDSLVTFISGDEFAGNTNTIEIYEKGGGKLLSITPQQTLDSTSVIKSVRLFDPRYKTKKNISTKSVFKDIKAQYNISSINNLINSVVITVNDINASITIDKNELPENLRHDMDLKYTTENIPNDAKIKYFFIHWNN